VAHIPDGNASISAADLERAGIPAGTERLLLRTANSLIWAGWDGVNPLAFH